jgi:hypothetical protein
MEYTPRASDKSNLVMNVMTEGYGVILPDESEEAPNCPGVIVAMSMLRSHSNAVSLPVELVSNCPSAPKTKGTMSSKRLVWLPARFPVEFSMASAVMRPDGSFTLMTSGIGSSSCDVAIFLHSFERTPA